MSNDVRLNRNHVGDINGFGDHQHSGGSLLHSPNSAGSSGGGQDEHTEHGNSHRNIKKSLKSNRGMGSEYGHRVPNGSIEGPVHTMYPASYNSNYDHPSGNFGVGGEDPFPPSPNGSPAPQKYMQNDYVRYDSNGSGVCYPRSGYDELDTTLMPPRDILGGVSQEDEMPSQNMPHYQHHGEYLPQVVDSCSVFVAPSFEAPRAYFEEDDYEQQQPTLYNRETQLMPSGGSIPRVAWRDPDLHEVIEFLANPNNVIKANAAAYLQHLCFMDDPVKTQTRQLGGILPLVALLSHEIPEIHRNACGALRNLSYGRQNDENKRAIKNAGGINSLVRLLRKTSDNEVKELVTGVLWNLSSCEDLKRYIIDEALLVLVNIVIIPDSGWKPPKGSSICQTNWTTVFRNASGILRNTSSAGDYGRKKLRECVGLVDSVLHLVKSAIANGNIDNKSVENCVCVLRNLSFRAQEVEDPNYDKRFQLNAVTGGVPPRSLAVKPNVAENLGCFGVSSKRDAKELGSTYVAASNGQQTVNRHNVSNGPVKGMELLWQPEIVQQYQNLLSNCSNPETLEAAAGAIQNLTACFWQPTIDIRAAVRKEKVLPILVELLRMDVDRVVCAVVTALRNLAIDQRNRDLIGRYAMRDLVQKLPTGNTQQDHGTSDDTIAAVLATLNEVIKRHPEFSRSLLEAHGVDRLMSISRNRQRYSLRVVKFASQVLYSMWIHAELRETYVKAGWKETDFVTKTIAARNARPTSPGNLNSTLNRPMASQSGTRFEDRTIHRATPNANVVPNQQSAGIYGVEQVRMDNLSLYSGGPQRHGIQGHSPGIRNYASVNNQMVRPCEPVYAQVNRERKKTARGNSDDAVIGGYSVHPHNMTSVPLPTSSAAYSTTGHIDHWAVTSHLGDGGVVTLDRVPHTQQLSSPGSIGIAPPGDSWV